MPKISCIVPVYKVEKDLPKCIDSIRAQTFTDFELILIDDGSPDNCPKICDDYAAKDSRIKVIHKQNGGVSSARNAGLNVAQGEYICFVDSDDWVEENYIETLCKMIANSKCDAAVCGFWGEKRRKPEILNQEKAIINIFSQKGYGGFSPKKILPLNLINSEPKTRYDETITYLEDSEFFYRLFKKCNSVYWDNIPLYHYEMNQDSVTNQKGITEQSKNAYAVLESLIKNEQNKNIKKSLELCYLNFRASGNLIFFLKKDDLTLQEKYEKQFCERMLIKNMCLWLFSYEVTFKEKILKFMLLFCSRGLVKTILSWRKI